MTLNEIIEAVFDELGEEPGGHWNEAEVVRWVQRALTRHAREALSVEAETRTTTLPNVQEYELGPDYGEMKAVRFKSSYSEEPEPLVYTDKQTLTTTYGSLYAVGVPTSFYVFQRKIGLYPIPTHSPFFECTFEDTCNNYVPIFDSEDETIYVGYHEFELVDTDECRVEISHVGVYLKREGRPYPGEIQMWLTATESHGDSVSDYTLKSEPILANDVKNTPKWVLFDFSETPLTLLDSAVVWKMEIQCDADYRAASASEYQGPGIQIGVDDATTDANVAWIQLHQLKDDLHVDFYRNTCPPILNPDVELDLPFYPPPNYHPSIITMVLDFCMRKGQYNMPAAKEYRAESRRDILYARAQATLATRGDIRRVPKKVRNAYRRRSYVDYVNGRFVGRI